MNKKLLLNDFSEINIYEFIDLVDCNYLNPYAVFISDGSLDLREKNLDFLSFNPMFSRLSGFFEKGLYAGVVLKKSQDEVFSLLELIKSFQTITSYIENVDLNSEYYIETVSFNEIIDVIAIDDPLAHLNLNRNSIYKENYGQLLFSIEAIYNILNKFTAKDRDVTEFLPPHLHIFNSNDDWMGLLLLILSLIYYYFVLEIISYRNPAMLNTLTEDFDTNKYNGFYLELNLKDISFIQDITILSSHVYALSSGDFKRIIEGYKKYEHNTSRINNNPSLQKCIDEFYIQYESLDPSFKNIKATCIQLQTHMQKYAVSENIDYPRWKNVTVGRLQNLITERKKEIKVHK